MYNKTCESIARQERLHMNLYGARIETWRERKEAMEAQASYNARLFYGKPLDDE